MEAVQDNLKFSFFQLKVCSSNWCIEAVSIDPKTEAKYSVLEVRPFHRALIVAEIPEFDSKQFKYDRLCLVSYPGSKNPAEKLPGQKKATKKKEIKLCHDTICFINQNTNSAYYKKDGQKVSNGFLKIMGKTKSVDGKSDGKDPIAPVSVLPAVVSATAPDPSESLPKKVFGFQKDLSLSSNWEQLKYKYQKKKDKKTIAKKDDDDDEFGVMPIKSGRRILYTPILKMVGYYSPRYCLDSYDGDNLDDKKMELSMKAYYSKGDLILDQVEDKEKGKVKDKIVAVEKKVAPVPVPVPVVPGEATVVKQCCGFWPIAPRSVSSSAPVTDAAPTTVPVVRKSVQKRASATEIAAAKLNSATIVAITKTGASDTVIDNPTKPKPEAEATDEDASGIDLEYANRLGPLIQCVDQPELVWGELTNGDFWYNDDLSRTNEEEISETTKAENWLPYLSSSCPYLPFRKLVFLEADQDSGDQKSDQEDIISKSLIDAIVFRRGIPDRIAGTFAMQSRSSVL